MPVRRLVAHAPLDALIPVFDEIRAKSGVVEGFSEGAIADVEAARALPDGAELSHVSDERVDLTDLPFVTLDPQGAKDLDQAVVISRIDDGFVVHYAIADVGAHVIPGGPLDRETRLRGETVYSPDRRIGLHPPDMSEGFASLLPGQVTKAAVWELHVNGSGELTFANVRRAWVRSVRQYAYTELVDPDAESREFVQVLKEFGSVRAAAMRRAGAVTLPKPSQDVVVTSHGLALEFRAAGGVEEHNSHLSLLTGIAAAQMMLRAGIGVLRTMPPATPEAFQRLRRQAKALGIEWAKGDTYADVLDRIDAHSPAGAAFLVQAVTLFRGARWVSFQVSSDNPDLALPSLIQHGALATPYAHVTAPLRRLVDRFGLEVCLAVSAGREVPDWVVEALPYLGEQMASAVRRSNAVDRACVDAVEAAVLEPHLGETFAGIGLDNRTVQLASPAVIARCAGGVEPGVSQLVRLVEADPVSGARFEVAE